MSHLVIELMDSFVQHPVIRIDFAAGKVGPTVRLTIKRLPPTQPRIDSTKFLAVLEQPNFEPRMFMLKSRKMPKAVRIRTVEKLESMGGGFGLFSSRSRINDVARSF